MIAYTAIASHLQKPLCGPDGQCERVASLDLAAPGTIVFAGKYAESICTKLNAINCLAIVCPEYEGKLRGSHIISAHPQLDYLRVAKEFFYSAEDFAPRQGNEPIIHPNAVVGEGTVISSGAFIGGQVTIGQRCHIHPNVVIVGPVRIGNDVTIKSGAVIGETGFRFERNEQGVPEEFPHFGCVEIGDNVFIGANTTVERATLDTTRIGDNVKIDDLVQIGHNSQVAPNCLITVGALLLGGAILEEGVYVAPHVVIRNKVRIGRDATLGMGAVVLKDVEAGTTVVGNPAKVLNR